MLFLIKVLFLIGIFPVQHVSLSPEVTTDIFAFLCVFPTNFLQDYETPFPRFTLLPMFIGDLA